MITDDLRAEINASYEQLESKLIALVHALSHSTLEIQSGWYNGHYSRTDTGVWRRESYPIPVVSVKGLCDIEISFEGLSVSTKRKRLQALEYSYDKIKPYAFEAYGVEDYLCDFYRNGQTIEELKRNIAQSNEREIGFTFIFPADVMGKTILEFVNLLRQEDFYY